MWDFFLLNIRWFIGGWYSVTFILGTILASYMTYEEAESAWDSVWISFFLVLISPIILFILLLSPLLIPWFITRKIVLKHKEKQRQLEKIKA